MTEENKTEYFDKVYKSIREVGYNLTHVFESEDGPSFTYSTGIYKTFKIPEIFISSLPPGLSSQLTENYIKSFKEKELVPLNEKLEFLIDRFPVYLIEVPISNLKDYVLTSIRFYQDEQYKYLQVIFPDTMGRFPNDIGYEYDQEIMGQFSG